MRSSGSNSIDDLVAEHAVQLDHLRRDRSAPRGCADRPAPGCGTTRAAPGRRKQRRIARSASQRLMSRLRRRASPVGAGGDRRRRGGTVARHARGSRSVPLAARAVAAARLGARGAAPRSAAVARPAARDATTSSSGVCCAAARGRAVRPARPRGGARAQAEAARHHDAGQHQGHLAGAEDEDDGRRR